MTKTKILISDNQMVVRQGIRALLERESDFEIVGESADGLETVEMVKRLKPDVVLMELTGPGVSGIDAVRMIKEGDARTEVVVMSEWQKKAYIREVLQAGALGYILKTGTIAEVSAAVRTARNKGYYLCPEISANIIDNFLNKTTNDSDAGGYNELTKREQQIFRLIAEGNSTDEIAEMLGISPKTVAKHRTNLTTKLGIKNTASLVRYALKIGIVEPSK